MIVGTAEARKIAINRFLPLFVISIVLIIIIIIFGEESLDWYLSLAASMGSAILFLYTNLKLTYNTNW